MQKISPENSLPLPKVGAQIKNFNAQAQIAQEKIKSVKRKRKLGKHWKKIDKAQIG